MMRAMPVTPVENPPWDHIETVLLDLDGTLLDLAFDNGFWLDFIPSVYAASRCLSVAEARAALTPRFRACEGTLNWYCIEYWSRELGLDIEALKRTQAHRIAWLPGAREFLARLRGHGKRLVLLTNSHPAVLRIKDERTGVGGYLDAALSSHQFGAPKESGEFWRALREVEPFDPGRSVFVDDSPPVLHAARRAGIRWVYGVRRASSAPGGWGTGRDYEDIPAVDSVSDLVPANPAVADPDGRKSAGPGPNDPQSGAADGRAPRAARV